MLDKEKLAFTIVASTAIFILARITTD